VKESKLETRDRKARKSFHTSCKSPFSNFEETTNTGNPEVQGIVFTVYV
jgi:hypothetical protein